MKKIAKILLVAVFMLVFLTGCYKQDTVISVAHDGKISTEVTLIGTDDAIAQVTGGGTIADLESSLLPQINGMILDTAKEKCERVSETVNGQKLNGLKLTTYYSSFDEMAESQLFYSYNMSVAVPVVTGEPMEGAPGLTIKKEDSIWGSSYSVKGTISLTQGQEILPEELEKLKSASANLTFKFPFGSFSSSAGNSNIVMPTFTFAATTENDNVPVDFNVFVPNYLIILGILLILILIIAVIVMALKIKKLKNELIAANNKEEVTVPDAETFVSKDDEEFFEGSDETEEFAEETVEEAVEEAEEVVEEVVEEAEEATDEATEETDKE